MRKRFLTILMIMALANFFIATVAYAQDEVTEPAQATEQVAASATDDSAMVTEEPFAETETVSGIEMFARKLFGSGLVDLFIQGGFTMWPILLLLIWGIATVIWKLVSLNYAKINVVDFLNTIEPLLKEKKYDEVIKICENTRGPVSSIIHAGLLRVDKGLPAVEKAIENAGVIEMAFLEKGFIPLSTVITLAPMFGFFGTMVGMIKAFTDIAAAGEVEPTIVATGISIALVTTAAGLAVAIPMQFFNNLFLGSIDTLVMDMQRGSERVIEILGETK